MLTMPILIVVGVTPRNDAVSAGAAVVATAAGAVVAAATGGALFLALLQATSDVPVTTSTATSGATRERPMVPPSAPRPSPAGVSPLQGSGMPARRRAADVPPQTPAARPPGGTEGGRRDASV